MALADGGRHIHMTDEGVAIALIQEEGQVYAMSNRCVHRGGSIGDGTVEGGTITCPMHDWIFRLVDGRCVDNPEMKLKTYPVLIENEMIKVQLENI